MADERQIHDEAEVGRDFGWSQGVQLVRPFISRQATKTKPVDALRAKCPKFGMKVTADPDTILEYESMFAGFPPDVGPLNLRVVALMI